MNSSLKVACVLADYLPVQVEQQRRKLDLPILIPHPIDGSVIFACSPEASAAGIYAGLSLYQARQMLPQAVVIEPDEHAYHAAHGAMQAALQAYSPLIETVSLGEFLIDVRAVSAIHGGDESLAAALAAAAQDASGLAVRVGLAGGRFIAEQAARQAPAGAALVVPPGGEGHFLSPLPLDVLPGIPGEMRRRLYLLDLFTLGELAHLPRAAVLRQFGGEIANLYDLARGHDPRPLSTDSPPLRLVSSMQLPSPTDLRETLLQAVKRRCRRLSEKLSLRGYHAEALKLTLYLEDGTTRESGQFAKPPTSDGAQLNRLAALLLGKLQVTAPVAAVAVCAYPLRAWHIGMRQLDLAGAGVPERQLQLQTELQGLFHKFGQTVVRVAALLGPPVPLRIWVKLSAAGKPAQIEYGGQVRVVLEIDEEWREESGWWDERKARRRDYFRVMLGDESYRNIFQDLNTQVWYLDRAWPLL